MFASQSLQVFFLLLLWLHQICNFLIFCQIEPILIVHKFLSLTTQVSYQCVKYIIIWVQKQNLRSQQQKLQILFNREKGCVERRIIVVLKSQRIYKQAQFLPCDRLKIPRLEPQLFGGEGLLSGAKTNVMPSAESVVFGQRDILMVNVVLIIAGHAITGCLYKTRPTSFSGSVAEQYDELDWKGSDVRLKQPLYGVTAPVQIRLPLLQLSWLNDENEKLRG